MLKSFLSSHSAKLSEASFHFTTFRRDKRLPTLTTVTAAAAEVAVVVDGAGVVCGDPPSQGCWAAYTGKM